MKYILKLYYSSKYLGYEKTIYKEFDNYNDLILYLLINIKNYTKYIIYEKTNK